MREAECHAKVSCSGVRSSGSDRRCRRFMCGPGLLVMLRCGPGTIALCTPGVTRESVRETGCRVPVFVKLEGPSPGQLADRGERCSCTACQPPSESLAKTIVSCS